MTTIVNGEPYEAADGLTVGQLLEALGAPRTGVAVARNDVVVKRCEYDAHRVSEGDRIEIIKAVAGG